MTILVGPQATGKSIFLQIFRLLHDAGAIGEAFRKYFGIAPASVARFMEMYLGKGTGEAARRAKLEVEGSAVSFRSLLMHKAKPARVFSIPAQRVLALREGITRPFMDFQMDDPFCLREFSDRLHALVQQEFASGDVFPRANRLKECLREAIAAHIYPGVRLRNLEEGGPRRLMLETKEGARLGYLAWSAGQREFAPLLLGLYWLLPAGARSRREPYEWVIVEEPEAGLHPDAIMAVMGLMLELLVRGYRVLLSTHSPQVLEVAWALSVLRRHGARAKDVQDMLGLYGTGSRVIAEKALQCNIRVYFFTREGEAVDISGLDPGDPKIADWGGLAAHSLRIQDVVARVVSRATCAEIAAASTTEAD